MCHQFDAPRDVIGTIILLYGSDTTPYLRQKMDGCN